ncbi:MAG: signal transduction histidine kinase/ligand-binding sensor domain-containing protein [Polaribacter sp.]|jgi:signal transduction histidine kinase/ligand-binding sensor domain-containing protein/DNA-binding response OmpR family regulator
MSNLFKQIIFVISLYSCLSLHAQSQLNEISETEGLSQNTIKSIIQDSNGFIWVGTYNGINKYDGYSMVHYNFSNDVNSLSSNIIISLFEDKDGYIWAGTTDAGLNRIDPSTGKIEVYFDNPNAPDYVSEIDHIYQSSSGVLFIKTPNGFKFFKVAIDGSLVFEKVMNVANNFSLLAKNIVPALNGKHWFFTPKRKIKLHQVAINEITNVPDIKVQSTDIKAFEFDSSYPVNFIEYPKNTIWVISNRLQLLKIKLNNQLQVIDRELIPLSDNSLGFSHKNFKKLAIAVDQKQHIWVAGNGILLNYDTQTGEKLNLNSSHRKEIAIQQAQQLMIDNTNILWLGTLNHGLYKMDLENNTFLNSNEFLNNSEKQSPVFHEYPILTMCEDSKGDIWLGTQGRGGLAILKGKEIERSFLNKSNKVWDYNYLAKTNTQFDDEDFFEIKRLMNDSKNNIWVGAKTGLSKITFKNNSETFDIQKFNDIKDKQGTLIKNSVFAIEEDRKGNIWVGYWRKGIAKITFNTQSETYTSVNYQNEFNNTNSLSNNLVRDILEDSNGDIWVGTIRGLNKLKQDAADNIAFTGYLNDPENKNSLSNNYVLDVFQASDGLLYVGTFGGGLNQIEISNNTLNFKHYTKKEGLPSDVVYQIKEDNQGNIWMLHVREISKLNPKTGAVTYFENQDGINVSEFKDNAMLFTNSGMMLCGGVNGITFFQPDRLSVNEIKPQLIISDFKLFNEIILPLEKRNGKVILKKGINETKKIVLPYSLNSMEFVFSSLHFSNPEKNQYKYILEGFDEKWQYSKGNERRFASYTNVPPGNYIFKVFGSNSVGVWTDEPKEISVLINKPWYLTTLAIFIFSLLTFAIIYSFVKIRLNQIHLKSKMDIESAVHENSEEMNQMKLQFFTNISHELRTPLTLIVGPLSQIMNGRADTKDIPKLNSIMYKNSNRLLKLINQLLDFRKAESGNLNLIVQNDELVSFVGEVFTAFEDIALEKDIKFLFLSPKKELDAWFDNDKIEKILYNLLSNAFKFTPKGKGITVSLEKETINSEDYAIIKVIDFGIGIPKDELISIFDRFYQTRKENNAINEGSGLGLAYIKHLVEIHKGEINIQSEFHKGTTCTVTIPISKTAYSNNSIIELQPQKYDFKYTKIGVDVIKENQLIPKKTIKSAKEHSKETPLLLIVEDNRELQDYLVTFFSYDYRILTANNGKEGLEQAIKNIPSVIISDLMMPEMNGIEMCKKLKTDINTSHIPILILTAKAGLENEKEGLETGADEFILKPFNIEVLKLRLDNILRTKEQWIQKFRTNSSSKSWKELSNKLDQKFIEKSINIIKKNLDNTEFSVEKFALEIGMSRSALFLKLKSITGQSTSEFIRTIRLNKAAKLIESGKYSITEVIYMVGFSDPKYFRTCFKKHFECTPSSYFSNFKKVAS